ncbi:MAG: hypothetical protein IMW99_11115 [Firmicutes bacterium]|nr:hypothetical protein [Bacillota bacterium]
MRIPGSDEGQRSRRPAGVVGPVLSLAVGFWLAAAAAGALDAGATSSGTPEPLARVANDFIAITVNAGAYDTGRFAVDTTGGDPGRSGDENQPLIYGRPEPWTSYTTLRIDGRNYAFGGRTQRRAGAACSFGQLLQAPTVSGNTIQCAWQEGPVRVTQILSLVKGPTTSWPDTALISYVLENTDSSPHQVGVRVMLDTMLGSNDGAPFRFGSQAITTDQTFSGGAIPDFWQAFDSLKAGSEKVIAQGTLRDPAVTVPDRVVVSNWGSLADEPWNLTDLTPGRDFTRKGEYELDSAIALYWDERPLGPGQRRVVSTEYGLGGITMAPGQLSVGVSAPSQVVANPANPPQITIVAYVQNVGPGDALNTLVQLKLPDGMRLQDGEADARVLGRLNVGQTGQAVWHAVVLASQAQTLEIQVVAQSVTAGKNQVVRHLQVLAPGRLQVQVFAPASADLSGADLPYIPVRAVITNVGAGPIYQAQAKLGLPVNLEPARMESPVRFLGTLEPRDQVTVIWKVQPVFGASGNVPYSVQAEGRGTQPVNRNQFLRLPPLQPRLVLVKAPNSSWQQGYVTVFVQLQNVKDFAKARVEVHFDPKRLQVLDVSRGVLLAEPGAEGVWSPPAVDNARGVVVLQVARRPVDVKEGQLAAIHFYPVGDGNAAVRVTTAEIRRAAPAAQKADLLPVPVALDQAGLVLTPSLKMLPSVLSF